jgi:hypothetical protein
MDLLSRDRADVGCDSLQMSTLPQPHIFKSLPVSWDTAVSPHMGSMERAPWRRSEEGWVEGERMRVTGRQVSKASTAVPKPWAIKRT